MLTVLAPACLPYWKLRCTCRARLISAGALVSCAYFSEYVHELRISRTPSRDVQSDCKFAQMISSSLQDRRPNMLCTTAPTCLCGTLVCDAELIGVVEQTRQARIYFGLHESASSPYSCVLR